MSLMLFYMADSFHSARTPKLRLAHLKRLPPRLVNLARHLPFKSSTPRIRGALALPGLLPRVALLTLRFRFEKYAQHTFSTETERRKNSDSSQSLARLLRLTTTNQID